MIYLREIKRERAKSVNFKNLKLGQQTTATRRARKKLKKKKSELLW